MSCSGLFVPGWVPTTVSSLLNVWRSPGWRRSAYAHQGSNGPRLIPRFVRASADAFSEVHEVGQDGSIQDHPANLLGAARCFDVQALICSDLFRICISCSAPICAACSDLLSSAVCSALESLRLKVCSALDLAGIPPAAARVMLCASLLYLP